MSSNPLVEVKAPMLAEFINAGHTSLAEPTPDESHPLHELFLDTRRRAFYFYSHSTVLSNLKSDRDDLHQNLLGLKYLLDNNVLRHPEILSHRYLPSHAAVLALRFATLEESDNVKIVELLTTLNMLHLWHVPPHTDTGAEMPETNDDAEDSTTAGAPTEGDSNLETALKVELANADRKIKVIQDAKKDLKRKLALVEETELAVLHARDAMTQTQNAMAKADLALQLSPISFLVEDN